VKYATTVLFVVLKFSLGRMEKYLMIGQGIVEQIRSFTITNKALNIPIENSEIGIIDTCQESNNKSIGHTTIESGSKLGTMAGPKGFEPLTFSLEG
jgi:hypothetical protein